MARGGIKAALLLGAAAGIAAATPHGRRWVGRTLGAAKNWLEFKAEDVGQLLEARAGRAAAARRAPASIHGAASRQMEENMVIARVREGLARENRVHARKIRVLSIGGVIHLEGTVDTPEEREIAGAVAEEAARAHVLVNDLHVASVARDV